MRIRIALACSLTFIAAHASAQKLKQAVSGPFYGCTADQRSAVESAAGEALKRVWRAKTAYAGIGPAMDDRQAYELARERRRAEGLETAIFGKNDTDISFYLTSMYVNLMERNRDIRCAPASDKECGVMREAYVRSSERKVIWVCPNFFQNDPKAKAAIDASAKAAEQRARTLVHESAHTAGISESSAGESYCAYITCDSGCGDGGGPGKGTNVADNWSAFVHCAGGQAADAVPVVGPKAP